MPRPHRLLAALFALSACAPLQDEGAPPEGAHEHLEQPLLGSASYTGCNTQLKSFANASRFYGRVASASDAFVACVDRTMRQGFDGNGPYLQCSGDPAHGQPIDTQIAKALEAARSPNDLHMTCNGGTGGLAWTGQQDGHLHGKTENFTWGNWFTGVHSQLSKPVCTAKQHADKDTANCRWAAYPWPYNQTADTIWHEAVHTQNYGHGHNDDNVKAAKACGHEGDNSFHYQRDTIPYIIGGCINWVIKRSHSVCQGGLDAAKCGDGALQLVTGLTGTSCECVHDPSNVGGVALLTGEGSDDFDLDTTIDTSSWTNPSWYPTGPLVPIGGGDFNGDGRADFALRESGGTGDLVFVGHDGAGASQRIADLAPGSFAQSWNLGAQDVIAGIGNFDGWTDDELVIRSGWGLGIIGHYNNWRSYALHPFGTSLGSGWTLSASDEVAAVADFDGDGLAEMLLQAADGAIGIAELSGNSIQVTTRLANGSKAGDWTIGSHDHILGAADFDADGRADYVVRSGWGIGIVGATAAGLSDVFMKPWGHSSGGWIFASGDTVDAIADLDGDGRSELVMRDATRMAALELSGSALTELASASHQHFIGSWAFEASDALAGAADLYDLGRDQLMLQHSWGIAVIEVSGGAFTTRAVRRSERMAGAWQVQAGDGYHGRVRAGGGREALLLSR